MHSLECFGSRCGEVSGLKPTSGERQSTNHALAPTETVHQCHCNTGDLLIPPGVLRQPGVQMHTPAPALCGDSLGELVASKIAQQVWDGY